MSLDTEDLSALHILEMVCVVVKKPGKQLAERHVIVGSENFQLFVREGLQPANVSFRPEPLGSHLLQARQNRHMNSRLEVVNDHQR